MITLTQIVRAAPGAASQVARGEIRPLTERAAVAVEVPTTPSGGVSMAQVHAAIAADNARDDAAYDPGNLAAYFQSLGAL